ncbi:hypothetical protein ACWDUL_31855, partial [Nocardia niigatensis]
MMNMNPGGRSSAIASFVTYVKALEALDRRSFPDEYAEHSDRIRELEPFLRAHGILDVMDIKNPEAQSPVDGRLRVRGALVQIAGSLERHGCRTVA